MILSIDWESFVHVQAKVWLDTALNWLNYSKSLLVVHYEHVKTNPIQQLDKILSYLSPEAAKQSRLSCLQVKYYYYKIF